MKIKFNSNDDLPRNFSETLKLYTIKVVVKYVCLEGNKYYPQDFLDK